MKGIMKKLLVSIILLVLLLISGSKSMSYAYNMYVRQQRFDGKKYYYNTTPIYDYTLNNSSIGDYYCLKGGASIGNTVDSSGWIYEAGYNKMTFMNTDVTSLEDTTGIKLRSSVQYNNSSHKYSNSKEKSLEALRWLVKNMYLVSSDTTATEKSYMKSWIESLMNKYCGTDYKNCKLSSLSDEQIGAIQQFVVWKFLEPNENASYYQSAITGPSDVKKITGFTTDDKAKCGYALYYTLCVAAIEYANGNGYTMSYTSNNKCSVTASKTSRTIKPVVGETNTYKVGPIKITASNLQTLYIYISGSQLKNWTILDSSNNVILKSADYKETTDYKSKLTGKNFYIKFTTDEPVSEKNNLSFSYTYLYNPALTSCTGNVYYKKDRQPILEVNKDLATYSNHQSITLLYNPPEYEFDLSLTKEIAQVYRYDDNSKKFSEVYNSNNAGSNRLLSINNNTIAAYGTAQYFMNKTPVTVNPGDIIRYKITVYNEGDTDGYVRQIKDYLPKGLEYLNMTTSTEYGKYNYQNRSSIKYTESEFSDSENLIRYEFSGDGKKISVGTSFSIYIECKVSNDVKSGDVLRNVAAISSYGHKDEFGNYVSTEEKGVDRDSVQTNLWKNFIDYSKGIDTKAENVDLSNVDKGTLVEEDDEDFEQVKVGGFDLALRKFITKVYNDNSSYNYSRAPNIWRTTITDFNNGKTTARYTHTKSPVSVGEDDTVVYTIRVYNEGYINGIAKEIKDYLPSELVLKENSEINTKYGWKNASDGSNYVYTNYLKDTTIKPSNGKEGFSELINSGGKLDNDKQFWNEVQIECVVTGVTSKNGKILTNMAEITNYGYNEINVTEDGTITTSYKKCSEAGIDRDSVQSTLLNDLSSNGVEQSVQGYYNYQTVVSKHNIFSDTEYHGLEDDDDFENVKVVLDSFDLALRKYITKVNGVELETNREPIINIASAQRLATRGTAIYYHIKDPVDVNPGDTVTYKIRIYNEGYKEGTVKEITDYLPAGLEFIEDSTVNKDNGWMIEKNSDGTIKKNSDGSTTIKTNKEFNVIASNAATGYAKLDAGTLTDAEKFWEDVEVECKVTSIKNGKILTNVAEITNYGYMKDETYIQADKEGVDFDSQNNNVFGGSSVDTVGYYNEKDIIDNKNVYNGREDDDDFENIKVNSKYSYDLLLKKTDEGGEGINGARFSVTKMEAEQSIGEDVTDSIGGLFDSLTRDELFSGVIFNEGTPGEESIKVENLEALKDYFYLIKEESSADGYSNLLDGYTIVVPTYFGLDDVSNKVKLNIGVCNVSAHDYYEAHGFVILKDDNTILEDTDDLYSKVKVTLNNDLEIPQILVTVENKKLEGSYNYRVKKVDENGNVIGNMSFETQRIERVTNEDGTTTTTTKPKKTMTTDSKVGYRTYYGTPINGVGVDSIRFTEIQDENNLYIELADPIIVNVTKEINEDNKYVITKVAFEGETQEATIGNKVTKKANLIDGTTVDITAEIIQLSTNGLTVIVTVPNKKIKGSYGMKILKNGENSETKLSGVTFSVKDNNENILGENFTTENDGMVTILDNKPITEVGIDWYEITELNVGDNAYIKLKNSIKVYVEKVNKGTKFDVNRVSFEPIIGKGETTNEISVYLENGNTVLAQVALEDGGIIKVTIANEKITGKYYLKIRKSINDEDRTPIQGVSFKVQEGEKELKTSPTKTNTSGRLIVIGETMENVGSVTKKITAENVNIEDAYTITEINLDGKPYVKLKDPITVYIHKELVNGYEYKATGISFKQGEQGSMTETTKAKLENGNEVEIRANIDKNNTIIVDIPNDKVTGKYGLEIVKTGEKDRPLKGVTFKVVEGEGDNARELILNDSTDESGKVTVVNDREITLDTVGTKDVFTITEVKTDDSYIKVTSPIKVYVEKARSADGNSYIASKVSFASDSEVTETEITLQDNTTLKAKAEITDEGIVRITVPNKKITGKYGLEIVKTGEEDKPLQGVTFKVVEGEGDNAKELELTSNSTDENGKITVFTNRSITSDTVGLKDVFTITEIKTDDVYVALPENEKLKIYVTKGKNNAGNEYVAKQVSFEKDKYVGTKVVTLSNGKEVTVSVNIVDGLVTITIPNRKVEGKYDLELIKVDQKDGETLLPGVTFDITVKKGNEEVKLYDVDGEEINTKGLTTNEDGKIALSNVKITEGASYTYEITETKVPEGYVMLKDPIKVNFKTKIDNFQYVVDEVTISGFAKLDASSNKIIVKVQNGQFDLALRKFITGVTTGVGTDSEKKLEVPDRVPVFKVDENGNYVYEHSKEPVIVGNQNIVEYTLRVYNEGSISGYASEIKDDIPEGLEFIQDNEINKKYGWILLDEEENETKDVNKAKYIVSNYLSKNNEQIEGENLLKAFNTKDYEQGNVTEPYYKEVKVAFKVTMPNTEDKIIINKAQISDDSDEFGDDVTDKDSTPDVWNEGEDDQDIEKVKVQYFDLSLRKWVTKAIVIEDGKETVTETGHTAEDDPEEVVKVDLQKSKLGKVVVKFEYNIRVKNEGEIAGVVKEISDYVPEGLKFEAADNPLWEESEGKVITNQLKDTLLQPGETAEVSIVLTWINRTDNMGLKVNVAEISKDYNEYGSPDIDSTPNNQVPGEDDIDDAPVMLTVKTGQVVTYVGITFVVLVMLGTGIAMIRKYVLK